MHHSSQLRSFFFELFFLHIFGIKENVIEHLPSVHQRYFWWHKIQLALYAKPCDWFFWPNIHFHVNFIKHQHASTYEEREKKKNQIHWISIRCARVKCFIPNLIWSHTFNAKRKLNGVEQKMINFLTLKWKKNQTKTDFIRCNFIYFFHANKANKCR